jgi:hypothetical protein
MAKSRPRPRSLYSQLGILVKRVELNTHDPLLYSIALYRLRKFLTTGVHIGELIVSIDQELRKVTSVFNEHQKNEMRKEGFDFDEDMEDVTELFPPEEEV